MSKTDTIRIGAVVVVLAAACFFAFWRRSPYVLAVGEYAPDFTLPALAAGAPAPQPIHLFKHRGHVVLVNFWATWCPPCVDETPSLARFAANMSKLDVEVIGVSVDQDAAALRRFVKDYQLSFPIARDPDQAVASQYGTFQFPETYILDRDGRVAEKIVGARDWQDPLMVSYVKSLALAGD